MFLLNAHGTINLDSFEKIYYRESFWGAESGYPVEASKTVSSSGILGGTETKSVEIARFNDPEFADKLVTDITAAWIAGKNAFDVEKWIVDNQARDK